MASGRAAKAASNAQHLRVAERANPERAAWEQIREPALYTPPHRTGGRSAMPTTARMALAEATVGEFMCANTASRPSTTDTRAHSRNKKKPAVRTRARRPITDSPWTKVSPGKFGTRVTSFPRQCMCYTFLQVLNGKLTFDTT